MTTPKAEFAARVPVVLESPGPMRQDVSEVLAGEYEAGLSGHGLTVLDIGANVGAFSIWADMRWPGSQIHAYEPEPGTFAMLQANTRTRPNIQIHNQAVSSLDATHAGFSAQYSGDGEATLVTYFDDTFSADFLTRKVEVELIHPRLLPQADVVKVDVEGAEADVLVNMDLARTTLVVLEFQNDRNRERIKAALANDFALAKEDAFEWDELLDLSPIYSETLRGDHWGHLMFVNRNPALGRMTRDAVEVAGSFSSPTLIRRIARRISRALP